MTKGWNILEPLENLDFSSPISAAFVEQVCKDLAELNDGLKESAVQALRSKHHGKVAERLNGQYKASWDLFYNDFFSTEAWSFGVPANPPDSLDWKRAALVLHLGFLLSEKLAAELVTLPAASVMNSDHARNPEAFSLAHRHVTLCRVVGAIKSAQYEIEQFEFILRYLTVGVDERTIIARGGKWPFDAETMHEQILFGYSPTAIDGLINSIPMHSAIVAAGVIRTFLESVIFRLDFESSLSGASTTDGERWDKALGNLRNMGLLQPHEAMWATKLYEVLSLVIHEGAVLTTGETWAFGKLVGELRDRLVQRSADGTEARGSGGSGAEAKSPTSGPEGSSEGT